MAAAASSPLASSVEKTNGAKLSRLLIDGGTTVLRNVFDSYHPPENLAAGLNANYITLTNLLRRKILHKAQWNRLFAPSGVTPDSKTFDITLLFLLLTNICELTPPSSGWHIKPPPSDTSLEANLAGIKSFCNELYGHVTTTGVDTPLFTSLWQEISAVLVGLGLDQAEIDRLKAEHCEEEGYLDALLDWADTEEDIKSQLKELRQSQTKTQKDVKNKLQTQLEDHKTLEDSKPKVDEVHQIQTKTHGTTERVCETQLEEPKTLEDFKVKLDEVHQTQTDIQGTIERVRQTQQDDHGTLQISKSKLDEVNVCQTEDEIQETLERVRQTQTKTQGIVDSVVKTQEEHSETLQAVERTVHSLKEQRDKDREEEVLQNLAKSEFKGDIEYHVGRFQEGTREWVFKKVQTWLDDRNSQNRVMVITANAGMGKSVISAIICKRMQEAGRLSGSHFCQHNNVRYRNPKLMLQSLACHLCHSLPEYKQALVKQLSRNLGKNLNDMGVEELFALLFKEPLSTVADPGRNMLLVIDGLDESEYQERNELLDVIANHFCRLPPWIRFLCTTRPEKNIVEALEQLRPFQLKPNEEENVQDIKLLFEKRTQYLIMEEEKCATVEKLVEKSEGLMLYAFFLVSFIKENVSVLDQGKLDGSLPLAISSVYHSYFKRLENELVKEVGVKEENFLNLLCAVTASREPLSVDFVSKVLVPSTNSPVARRKVLKTIGSVSSLLPLRDGCLQVIHKCIIDWLTDTSCYGEHEFSVDEKEGQRILASLCQRELDDLKQKGVRGTQFSSTEMYALHHGVRHMLLLNENIRSQSLEECVQTYVSDLELVYAKLCIDDSIAAEDIIWLQKQEISQVLSKDTKELLNTLTVLLRKFFNTITNHPHVFFETVLNTGGRILSSMASDLLQNKYPEIPYMEYVHKQMQQGAVRARFQCSSAVACLDVSPKLDYMVCECEDGTIQLWSLHTGKQVWTRPVQIEKLYFHWNSQACACRKQLSIPGFYDVFSCFRSVVFHPIADVVLPGVLSHAYTFDGDLKPLYPESNCRFTVCSILGDKNKMLTNCLDDAKCIIMWSLKNGSEITRTTRNEDVLSFACSRDGKLLAISYSTGSISIVDAKNGFMTLEEIVITQDVTLWDVDVVCGMMKFSLDCQSLFCIYQRTSVYGIGNISASFWLNINVMEGSSCTLDDCWSYVPREFESHTLCSEAGFLLGDPITFAGVTFEFRLDKETVLTGYPYYSFIDMLNVSELGKTDKEATCRLTSIKDIVFSLSGDTVYVVSDANKQTVSSWDVSSGVLMAEKSLMPLTTSSLLQVKYNYILTVREGVLLTTGSGPLELWNYGLAYCVRSWPEIFGVTKMFPISFMAEERVACEARDKVIILDTTSGEIVSTNPVRHGFLVACNTKCQLLTWNFQSIQLFNGETMLWENSSLLIGIPLGIFSLSEQFVVIFTKGLANDYQGVYVLDTVSGETLHVLLKGYEFSDCKFISDEECVISTVGASRDYCLRLFNVRSGDLLSVIELERQVNLLATCPRKRLLAIDQNNSKHGFKLIQVHLPQDKDSRKSKRGLDNLDVAGSNQATGSSLKRRGESPSCSSSKRSKPTPGHSAVRVIKEGTPENVDLERLAQKIPDHWKKLGRRLLENDEAALNSIHKENEEYSEKAYKMLLKWKRAKGSGATFYVLHDALCHDLVNRKDLAEKFCLEDDN